MNQLQTTPMGKYRDHERPWKMIAIDFSKFVLIKPVKRATAEATINFLQENLFLKYGVPEILISDNGTQFKSKVFAEFLATYGVRHWTTANYHALANATEAANKTIKNAVRAYIWVETTQPNWDVNLLELNCALNTSYHTSTIYRTFSIVFGYEMHTNASTYTAVDNDIELTSQFEAIRQ